jgi:hypothetical protein
MPSYDFRFVSLAHLADAHRDELQGLTRGKDS